MEQKRSICMKHKKYLAVIMAVALVVVFFSGMNAYAAGGVSASVTYDGDQAVFTITATETIENFSGIRFTCDWAKYSVQLRSMSTGP